MPFGPLLEGRKKNDEEEEEEKREPDDGEEEEEDEEDEEDKETSALADEKQGKTRNEKCVCCDKLIKGPKYVFPKREGDVRSGKACCAGCYDKAIEKKNLELENLCHRCAAGVDGQKRKRGGRHVTLDPIFSAEFWTCEECKRKVRGRQLYIAKREKQGKPKPRFYKKIRKD